MEHVAGSLARHHLAAAGPGTLGLGLMEAVRSTQQPTRNSSAEYRLRALAAHALGCMCMNAKQHR